MRSPDLLIWLLAAFPLAAASGQNCCAPAVPQQGVMGETVALPQVLEIGLHYEYLRSRNIDSTDAHWSLGEIETDWHRSSLSVAYGIIPKLSISAILPYVWKRKYWEQVQGDVSWQNETEGIGDLTLLLRYSPLARSFVNYRELSLGFGAKIPTGSTDRRNYGFPLPEELQPGTGAWDFLFTLTYYQGFEPVDFLVSSTYVVTGQSGGNDISAYEFGNQFYYLFDSNIHILSRIDLSLALSGALRGHDRGHDIDGYFELEETTGRHQIWFVPGVELQVVPGSLGFQAYLEMPIHQDFNGAQLRSDYNVRVSLAYLLPLKKSSGYEEE